MKLADKLKQEKGSQLLEFVLLSPLLWLLFLFAFDQFTIMFNKQKALEAAYEAGRIASVQPNAGLARYHGKERGQDTVRDAIGVESSDITLEADGGWHKGNHLKAKVHIRFHLLASGELYELEESYAMMIENAEDNRNERN